MDGQESKFIDTALAFFKNNLLITILLVLGLIFLGIGLIQLFNQQSDIVFESAEGSLQEKKEEEKILVDVSGAVEKPGVYELKANARIKDALILAGGFAPDANRTYIAQNINLAAKLSDGMKIYIPKKDESNTPQVLGGSNILKININLATASELDSLPGIGKVTAEKIISSRPYNSSEDLMIKKVVGKKVYEQIKDRILY